MKAVRNKAKVLHFLALTAAILGGSVGQCIASEGDNLGVKSPSSACAQEGARVLFIGNSYTFGSTSAVRYYRADTVQDLYQTDFGGIPALVRVFADQAGVTLDISHATSSGFGLHDHVDAGLERFDRPWNCVVMQSLSMLDRAAPGDPRRLVEASAILADAVRGHNDDAQIFFFATWPRADFVHRDGRPWSGQGLEQMTNDIRLAYELAAEQIRPDVSVISVGHAWLAAISASLAVENPYEGIPYGQVSLWSYDQHHASQYGSYLSALVLFAHLTGLDPRSLSETELAAWEMGINARLAASLQTAAWLAMHDQELAQFTPAPGSQYRPGRRNMAPPPTTSRR